ncbi:hypothetical protein [Enhygromyxa salina]|uniref:PsbP C-terminal domain-containing protein n=1 Tax=Enhygromyxa salina TaxID=215803 RepID=A0A2S9XV39_9BACT|nr:hypothetical protein [Enhygromyxa salina]PRP96725.1 hypothetical protein ENSA7_67950 [Enhygromyxa salina]
MIRSAIITSLVLSLALATGCDKTPPGTDPPDDGSATADTKGKDKKKGKGKAEDNSGGDEGGGNEEDPTKKVCPAETADYPAPYFGDTVLIRLPKNVTEDNFVEQTPSFASLTSKEIESVSCIEGMPGGVISYMAMTFFADDKRDIAVIRDETLEAMGYTGHTLSEEKRDDGTRYYQAVLDVPPSADNPEPARALFQMNSANGMMYAIVIETHPAAWNALKETFYATTSKMSFLAP